MNRTKKWLALGFSLLSISLLVACGNSQKNSEKASQEVQTEKSSTSEAKNENKSTYSIGDTITFDNYAEYTITKCCERFNF